MKTAVKTATEPRRATNLGGSCRGCCAVPRVSPATAAAATYFSALDEVER